MHSTLLATRNRTRPYGALKVTTREFIFHDGRDGISRAATSSDLH
jgi:hypothetical protein